MKRRLVLAMVIVTALVHRGGAAATAEDPFTLALTGDSTIMQRLQVFEEPEFTKLFDLIRRRQRSRPTRAPATRAATCPPGIEIYKGKPIFYSLSNFIFQNETVLRMPADSYEQYSLAADAQPADYLDARNDKDRRSFPADREYWDSVAVVTKWDGGRFVEAQLPPITLGFQTPRSERGRPKLATGADAARILEMVTTRSKAFGATVTVRNGVGIVTP